MTCLFCDIVARKLPANILYQDEYTIAFDDIQPVAPCHKIIIPQTHIATLNDLSDQRDKEMIVAKMTQAAIHLAKTLNLAESGYRLVMNCNPTGGQTIYHIHLHLIAGRQMMWPPG